MTDKDRKPEQPQKRGKPILVSENREQARAKAGTGQLYRTRLVVAEYEAPSKLTGRSKAKPNSPKGKKK